MAITDLAITNNAVSLTVGAINNTDNPVTFSITPGDGNLKFPATAGGKYFHIVVKNPDNTYEIMHVTARTSDSLTATRAQEGTTALSFSSGAAVEMRLTAQDFNDIIAYLAGAVSNPATNLTVTGTLTATGTVDLSAAAVDILPSGMTITMFQTTIPDGWTLAATSNDTVPIMRSTNTVAGGTGGSWTLSGISNVATTLTAAQSGVPAHTHPVPYAEIDAVGVARNGSGGASGTFNSNNNTAASAASSHTHSMTLGNTWRPSYVYCWRAIRS